MTSKWAVTTAVFINYVLGFSIFIAPEKIESSYIGSMPGLIILISLAVLFSDIQLIPVRYKQEYNRTFFVLELILSLLMMEFFMVKVWTRIEGYMFSIMKFLLGRGNLFEEMGGINFMSLLISGIALCFLLYAIGATNSAEAIINNTMCAYNQVEAYWMKLKELALRNRSCHADPQVSNFEPAQMYSCNIKCSPITPPITRNPHCPIHGDREINHHMQATPVRSTRRKMS